MKIELDVTAAGNISFWKKVSSEATYDFLRFYIDGSLQEQWSGEDDWSEEIYLITFGTHIFEWKYVKDTYVTGGDDCAWIDYIVFPPFDPEVLADDILAAPFITKLYGNYPNPFNPITNIRFDIKENESGALSIYNTKGQFIESYQFEAGQHNFSWNAENQSSGVYFYKLQTESFTEIRKMILLR
ncbi:MAG: T9SS type A sorting domain-containing protein [Candidatus Cloacimonetes bacterium]|nr:T9SS type A sorting domain-containing protein [Candidatus Cloacimonadota bacterium]